MASVTFPADFLYENFVIQSNVIGAAHHAAIARPIFLELSCIYPKQASHSITEDALLTGPLEPNKWYAIANFAGLKLTQGAPPAAWPRSHDLCGVRLTYDWFLRSRTV